MKAVIQLFLNGETEPDWIHGEYIEKLQDENSLG